MAEVRNGVIFDRAAGLVGRNFRRALEAALRPGYTP
jgi:hypothetical protein